MTLSTAQGPKLAVVFPHSRSDASFTLTSDKSVKGLLAGLLAGRNSANSVSVTIDILPNAEISIVEQNLVPVSSGQADITENEKENERQKNSILKLSRALAISGDIGIWTEWASKWDGGKP
jgi:hypothetical protein